MNIVSGADKIHVLPIEVVSRIAAGEVIERPAAVVKELIDNSVDAASRRITVEILEGGRGLIRVTDDGEGMNSADALAAFQRHATSKLRSEEDLTSIETMGFRGEALPSIASVSKVRLRTACRAGGDGTQLTLMGGRLTRQDMIAAAPGTQIEVTALFYNTPARKKFLKTIGTEFSHICQVVQQAALARPDIHFRLKHNDQDVVNYPSVASHRDRALHIYGLKQVEQWEVVKSERPGLRIEGLTVNPVCARTTRSPQELFVNRRAIKNSTVSHAIYDGYGTALPKGFHPVYIMFMNIDPARVDVNVHPTKREVRFADQELVHQTVRQVIRDTVGVDHAHVVRVHAEIGSDEPQSLSGSEFQERNRTPEPSQAPIQCREAGIEQVDGASSFLFRETMPAYLAEPACDVICFGQVSRTFIVAQVDTELQIVDQHTAHERVLFERLWRAWRGQSVQMQPLLIPESVDVPPHAVTLLREHIEDLMGLGLDIEPFGGTSFVIRAIPALLGHIDYAGLVHDLIDDLTQWNSTSSLEAKTRPVLASLACHAAVRAGRQMALPEMKRLIEEWLQEGQPATCPHGRRIALRFSSHDLAKIFGR